MNIPWLNDLAWFVSGFFGASMVMMLLVHEAMKRDEFLNDWDKHDDQWTIFFAGMAAVCFMIGVVV